MNPRNGYEATATRSRGAVGKCTVGPAARPAKLATRELAREMLGRTAEKAAVFRKARRRSFIGRQVYLSVCCLQLNFYRAQRALWPWRGRSSRRAGGHFADG